jgi:hypothetical protein
VEQGFGKRRVSCRIINTPEWRNGRRGGLKIRWSQGRVGSTPSSGTNFLEDSPYDRPGSVNRYEPARRLIGYRPVIMSSYSHSGQHWFLELTLSAHAQSFTQLEQLMDAFQPLSQEEINNERQKMWNYIRSQNPEASDENLKRFVEDQILLGRSEQMQYFAQFLEPFAVQAIAITVLSHALVEATINAILALGLHYAGKSDLFAILEQANVKHKWTLGPKSFLPEYVLPRSDVLFRELSTLCRRRNAYLHSKIELRDKGNKVVLRGSPDSGLSIDKDARNLVHRFLSLPYELHQQLLGQVEDQSLRFTLQNILQHKGGQVLK